MLGWYIPGLSELPLRIRLLSLLAGPFLRVFVFSIYLGTFGYFFLFSASCACVCMENCNAGEPGAVTSISGCWRVDGEVQRARSPFSCLGLACASRHEGSMNGFCLGSRCGSGYTIYEYIRVASICKIAFKRCLFLRRNCKSQEERLSRAPTLSRWRTRATASTRLLGRRATGLTVAEREECSVPGPNRLRDGPRGAGGVEAEREALPFVFLFCFYF